MALIKEKRKTTQKLLIALILLVILIPQQQAKADWIPTPENLINGFLNWANAAVLQATGKIIMWAARGLETFVNPQTQGVIINTFVVNESWRIIRDFVNMFFILILIVMAFGTIFDIQKFHWRSVLVPLLIAALLINFSLTIGEYVIKISNDLASVVLRQISGFSGDMAQGLSIQKSIPNNQFAAVAIASIANNSMELLVSLIFSLVFLVTSLLALLSAFIFALVRIPVLWFLLIISPIAWIGYSLPSLRSQTWSAWWKHFLCWCFFLPYYLFFLMFAVMFIRRKNDLAASLPPPDSFMATFTGPGGSFTDLLFYVLTMIFMIGGLIAAKKMACASGSGIKTVFSKIEGGVRKYAPGAGYVRAIGAGAKAGLQAKGEQIQEKGVLGIGGAQAQRLSQAKWTERFGFGAARGAAERVRSEEIGKEVEKIKKLNLGKSDFETKKASAGGLELLAMRQIAAKNGWVPRGTAGTKEIEDTIRTAGENSAFAQNYIKTLGDNNFTDAFGSVKEIEDFAKGTTILPLKKATLETMAKNNNILNEDMAKMVLDVFSTDTKEKRDKITEVLQKNIKNLEGTRNKKDRATYLADNSKNANLRELLAKQMSEDGEIDSYEKYYNAEGLLGGATNVEARKVFDKLGKDDPITQTEISFRRTLVNADPAYAPTPAEVSSLSDQYAEKMRKISERQLAELSRERWLSPGFAEALQKKSSELMAKFPAYPAVMPGAIDPLTGRPAGRKGRKAIPGGAERFKSNLKKIVGADPDKGPVVDGLPT